VHMCPYANRKIAQLSGGQQQRVALARALVIRPRALLLDEPLSNLDAKLRLEMRTEIRRVCKESGLTAIYVTHDQKEALSISDRMAILEGGRIAQIGRPEDVYRCPQSKVVADFIGETNFIEGTTVSRDGTGAVVETSAGLFRGKITDKTFHPSPGENVTLSIRPECWNFVETAGMPHGENHAIGRIGDAVYLGEVAQYRFLAGGLELKIFELNPQPSARSPDIDLAVRADPADVVVLPA
jgi:iron(III) transport system ATP-binding protein